MGRLIWVAHLLHTNLCTGVFRHSHTVRYGKRPRQLEFQITVFIHFGLLRLLLAPARSDFLRSGSIFVSPTSSSSVAVCFLHFFTAAFPPSEKLPEGLVVERIRQVLRHTLKTSETSVRPFPYGRQPVLFRFHRTRTHKWQTGRSC